MTSPFSIVTTAVNPSPIPISSTDVVGISSYTPSSRFKSTADKFTTAVGEPRRYIIGTSV